MNELNAKTRVPDSFQDLGSIDLEHLLTSCLPRIELLPLVKERVKLVIAQFVQRAPTCSPGGETSPAADALAYLRGVRAIPLPLELCTLMARVGFDKALFTYGTTDGTPVGYAEGLWLLKFVGLAENEPSGHQEATWLGFPGQDATMH